MIEALVWINLSFRKQKTIRLMSLNNFWTSNVEKLTQEVKITTQCKWLSTDWSSYPPLSMTICYYDRWNYLMRYFNCFYCKSTNVRMIKSLSTFFNLYVLWLNWWLQNPQKSDKPKTFWTAVAVTLLVEWSPPVP